MPASAGPSFVNLGLSTAGTPMSHRWRWEGHLPKLHQKSTTLYG